MCYRGFAGEDCSLSMSSIPNVYFTPFCDVYTQTCDSAKIYGDGFVHSKELTCTFQPAEVLLLIVVLVVGGNRIPDCSISKPHVNYCIR